MSVSITFRTTDNARWGAGLGHNLTADEIDLNFWNLKEAIEGFTAPDAITIASVTRSGTDMFLVMSDNTTIGPIPLPVLSFRYLGAWQPHFAYSVLDTFFVLGVGIFTAEIAHTSGSTFDPDITVAGDPALLQIFGATGTEFISQLADVDIADSNLADNDFFVFAGGSVNAWVSRTVAEVKSILSVPTNLDDLADVNAPSPTAGQVLKWNGSQWAAGTDNTGGGGGSGATALAGLIDVAIDSSTVNGQVLTYLNGFWIAHTVSGGGAVALGGLIDVIIDSTVHDGQVLTYNSGHWIPATPSGGGGGGGSGATALAGLTDVVVDSTLAAGQILEFNGTHWVGIDQTLDGLRDVDFGSTGPVNGDVLTFQDDSTGGHWRAEAPSGGGGSGISDAGTWNGTSAYSAGDSVKFTLNGRTISAVCRKNVSAPAGVAPSISASNTAGINNGASSGSIALTAGASDDLICILVYAQQGGGGAADKIKLTGAPTASGVTFTSRAIENIQDPADVNERIALELWTAQASGAFSQTISFNLSQAVDDGVIIAFSVSGATLPFDTNASVPNFNSGSTSSLTTDDAYDLIIYVSSGENVSLQPAPSGFSTVATVGNGSGLRTSNIALYSKAVTTTQSGVTIGGSGAQTTNLLDAFAHSVTDNLSPELDTDHWIVGAGGWQLSDLLDVDVDSGVMPGDLLRFEIDSNGGYWHFVRPKYVLATNVNGVLTASQDLLHHVFSTAVTFPANFGDFFEYASHAGGAANATATTIINIDKATAASPNSFSTVGTIMIAAGGVAAVLATAGIPIAFAKGDIIRIQGPSSADATFAGPYLTLVGYES